MRIRNSDRNEPFSALFLLECLATETHNTVTPLLSIHKKRDVHVGLIKIISLPFQQDSETFPFEFSPRIRRSLCDNGVAVEQLIKK